MSVLSGVDKFIEYFNIDLDIKTDPALLRNILDKDFKISGFELGVQSLSDQLNNAQDLHGFLRSIRDGIVEKHPAIDEFLSVVVSKKLISIEELSQEVLLRAIHTIYLHNCLLQFGDANHTNEYAFIQFLTNKRRGYGVQKNPFSSWIGLYGSLKNIKPIYLRVFFVIKIKSVDFVIKNLFASRIKTGIAKPLNLIQKLVSVIALIVNIAEAVITDLISGNFANALAGIVLNLVYPKYVHSQKTDLSKVEFGYSEQWSALYHTWNSAYITGTGVFHIIHKLINPVVANSETSEYMHKRVIALNNSLNFLIFNGKSNIVQTPLKNIKQIMRIWGRINFQYAKKLFVNTYIFKKEAHSNN